MAGNTFSNGNLFSPAIIQRVLEGSGAVYGVNLQNYSGSNVTGSNSYIFDNPGSAFKSTQQIPLDWSKFENHTFFNSAESKVNVSFDSIINYYPFDGSNQEIQDFLDGLSGYEKYVYDSFPKHTGYLLFSGTQKDENPANGWPEDLGTYIKVDDVAGTLYPSLSRNTSGENVLNPNRKSISFQFWINLSPENLENQTVFQKLDKNTDTGISLFVSESLTNKADLRFVVSSGSNVMSASYSLHKDEFIHISTYFDREPSGLSSLKLYHSGTLVASSKNSVSFGHMDFSKSSLIIGSGSSHSLGFLDSRDFIPETTFSGSLDDFRCYHGRRTPRAIRADYLKGAYPSKDLRLYFKFNEASGSYVNNQVVLDSSGNSLHSDISNFKISGRDQLMGVPPLPLEREDLNPVLFPGHPDVVSYNRKLLALASQYDNNNPNLITRLIPEHYLLESDAVEGFSDTFADTGKDYTYNIDFPGGGKIGQPQIIASLLFTWAKFFDEIKLFIDQFGNLLNIDYESDGAISDYMLPFLSNYYGFTLPNNFSNADYAQYLLGENLNVDPDISSKTLFSVQTEIWRRILVNLNSVIRSKGTVSAVKSIMRSAGINPDSMFRFREFGGSRTITTEDARRNRAEIASQLLLSSSQASVVSPFLSASRVEPGFPYASDPVEPRRSDGLLTSGSWSLEGLYQFDSPFSQQNPITQSLARFFVTGSEWTANKQTGGLLTNLVAFGTGSKPGMTGSLSLYARPNSEIDAPSMRLILTGVNIFDKNRWHISFGRSIGNKSKQLITASYFLRANRASNGEIVESYATSSVVDLGPREFDSFSQADDVFNVSGSYFEIGAGENRATTSITGDRFLNSNSIIPDSNARYTDLIAKVSGIRFWSLALSEKESKEHTRNFKSVGVEDPQINYNFVNSASGSWEKIRVNTNIDQQVTQSDSGGSIEIFDFSQNNFFLSGSGFEADKKVIIPSLFTYSILDPSFGERSAENKIRVRGFQEEVNIKEFNALKSPVRQIEPGQPTLDDSRFSIEVSAVGALNEDIVNILAGLDWLDNAIGAPELQFASDYPALRSLREVYFQRLTDKVNFENLFLFYKWFDDSLSVIIERLIPRTTKYLGINFVIESHFLERPKFRNMNSNIYLGASDRRDINNELLIAVLSGVLTRF